MVPNWKSFTLSRVALWFIASLVISVIFFQEFWASLGTMLSLDWIFGQHHASPWGVLGLCGIWLWLKRKEVWRGMNLRSSLVFFIPLGLALVAGAILLLSSQDFLVFQVLLASLGVFVIIFGEAAKIPSILLGIYGFAISLPLIIERFAQLPYSISAIKPVMWILNGLGYSLRNQGQWIHFTSSSGEPISAAITAACAGPATMGVLLAIFALMMLDIPLPPRKAGYMFLFGVVGTWLQSIIRLIILMLVGYHLGEDAMWTAHFWTIYILFPLWYLLFVYIYFRQAGSLPRIRGEASVQMARAFNA
jgi:exosortase/archaeosortase family protein